MTMNKERIQVTLHNKTYKEIDMSDYSTITEDVFTNREDVVKVVLPEGVLHIADHAFENCTNLEEIVFPSTLQDIGKESFVNCINLKKAAYGGNVNVDDTAFMGCAQLA